MAKPTAESARGLEVRGTVDPEKFKAARALAGDNVTFELKATRVGTAGEVAGSLQKSCVVCLICIICIVCAAAKADELGIRDLPQLRT